MAANTGNYYGFSLSCDDCGTVICFECGTMMANLEDYKKHLQEIHNMNEWRLFLCPLCPKKFADQINAAIHKLSTHIINEN